MTNRSWFKFLLDFDLYDVVLLVALGIWSVVTAQGQYNESSARVALAVGAVFFAPGYALVAALFPKKRAGVDFIDDNPIGPGERVSFVERIVLAIGLSVCLVPLIGLLFNYIPGGIDPQSVASAVGGMTVFLAMVATVRRIRAPPEERFAPRLSTLLGLDVQSVIYHDRTEQGRSLLTVLLIVGFVIAASGIGFAALGTSSGEQFTEFYLMSEDAETGELVAGQYPETIPLGETSRVHVGITNNEGQTMDYTVVVLLQSYSPEGELQEVQRLDVFSLSVPSGETTLRPHTIQPELSGEDLRVTYLLYVGSPPDDVARSPDNAYRQAHIWIDVPSSESG